MRKGASNSGFGGMTAHEQLFWQVIEDRLDFLDKNQNNQVNNINQQVKVANREAINVRNLL